MQVATTGKAPSQKILITSPGVYAAEVWQDTGGGITRFYDLAADPQRKLNLAAPTRGLLEIGWHGRRYKGEKMDRCCAGHILKRAKPDDICTSGCADWPAIQKKTLKAQGELAVIEQSPARIRVRASSGLTWWYVYAHPGLKVDVDYTFYPSGRIAASVRVRNTSDRAYQWSYEYGPHLMVAASNKKPQADRGFVWHTPSGGLERRRAPSEPLVLATSEKVKTSLMITIPTEAHKLFDRHMRHNGRSVHWDRAGYGSKNLVMPPGYDNTWACMIQMGSAGSVRAPALATATAAAPMAMQYRKPAKIAGAALVTDDPGDLNGDGYNESQACHVLKGPGPLEFTYARETLAFAPTFKITGWRGPAPKAVTLNGQPAPALTAVVNKTLLIHLTGRVEPKTAAIRIGK